MLRNNLDILHLLESDIINYSKLGSIVIMGGTNARTGTEYDCIGNNNRHIPVPFDMCKTSFIRKRKSQELTVCPWGKYLLELCTEANLSILNEKSFDDMLGKYTSFQYNGNSVFCHVHNHIPHLSDHAKLSVKLAAQFSHYMSPTENGVSYNMPNSYRWIKKPSFIFQKAFNTDDLKEKISRFMELSFIVQNQKFSTTEAVDSFSDIVYTACSKSLKTINRQKKSKRKLKSKKKWFDHDLMKMRREMLRKSSLFSKFSNDPIIRGSFFKFRKLYSHCKKKCKEFRSCLISQLDNMYESDPEAYWKLLKNLKEDSSPNDPSQSIAAYEWLKHFESLYKIKDKFSQQEKEFQNQLKDLTNIHTFSELDSRITDKEVLLAVRNLRNNKSAGLDGIKK